MADTFICEYCEKQFASNATLLVHQKRAKYCSIKKLEEPESKHENLEQTIDDAEPYCKYCSTIVKDMRGKKTSWHLCT